MLVWGGHSCPPPLTFTVNYATRLTARSTERIILATRPAAIPLQRGVEQGSGLSSSAIQLAISPWRTVMTRFDQQIRLLGLCVLAIAMSISASAQTYTELLS